MHGLSIALLVTFCASQPLCLRAQESKPLDKTVTVKADHERLEDVLDELAKKGYFTFSYQSDILKKDRLVTLTLKESTLREALELILGRTYDYAESDDYVVIRRREPMAARMKVVDPRMKMMEARTDDVTPRMKMMKRRVPYAVDSANMAARTQTVRDIINDMIADGLIKDKDSFTWFGLDNGQFVVDGRPMPDSLRAKYAAKYVKDGNGYYCGSVSVHGHGYFFDKAEIYGDKKQ
jgi:hypothetical protein